MKKIYIIIIIFLIAINAGAQDQHYLDSLSIIINTSKDIKTKIDAINAYAYEFRRGDVDSGKMYADKALSLSQKINYHKGIGDYYSCIAAFTFNENPDTAITYNHYALREYYLEPDNLRLSKNYSNMSNIFIRLTKYDSAGYYASLALRQIENDNTIDKDKKFYRMLWNYKGLGDVFSYTGLYDSSIFYLLKAVQIAERINNKNAEASCRLNVARSYGALQDYTKAILLTEEAYPLFLQTNDHDGAVLCLSNIGSEYNSLHKYELAKMYVDSALLLSNRYGVNRYYATNYQTLGEIERYQGNCTAALAYYKQALKYCERYYNEFIRFEVLASLGDAYTCVGNPVLAIQYYTQSLKAAEDDPENDLSCYEGLTKAYASINNYKKAFEFQKKYVSLNDSLFGIGKAEIVNELNTRYESEKKVQQIKLLEKDNKLKQSNIEKEVQTRNFAYAGALVLLFFGGFTYYRSVQRKKLNKQLDESLQQLRETQAQKIAIEREKESEKLRNNIARELHDEVGATLSGIAMYGHLAKEQIKRSNTTEVEKSLNIMQQSADEMVIKLNDIVWLVNPEQDSLQKLIQRLEEYATDIAIIKGIKVKINIPYKLDEINLPVESRHSIYLFCKEAINNAVKYSNATALELTVKEVDDKLEFSVCDNGKGFDPVVVRRGNGLHNMQKRADEIGAKFLLQSKLNEGCLVWLQCSKGN